MHPTGPESIKGLRGLLVVSTLATVASAISIPTLLQIRSPLGIDENPAPSPENGPAFSAGALRDKAYLPAEIGGIVGAYLFCLCFIALTLLTCARKSRQRAQAPRRPVDVEMIIAPTKPTSFIDTSPISPGGTTGGHTRNFSWPSPEKDETKPYVFPIINRSPITPPGTDPYVDTRIVAADKEMAARNLEDIYAHVMEQEEAKVAGQDVKTLPSPIKLQGPGSIPTAAPQRSARLDKSHRPSAITLDDGKSTKSRASSILSALSPRRKTASRTLQISSPLPTPKTGSFPKDDDYGDREPLSPKYYKPPPPVPTDQVPYTHSRNTSDISPTSPTRSIAEQLAPYGPGGQGYNGRSRYASQSSIVSQNAATIPSSRRAPAPHPLPTASNPTNQGANRALPFRQLDTGMKSPSFKPTTKTTVLERTVAQHSGPLTSGLKTPWTAGAVPYSPFYQPQTPMIPVTPRLITKEDRKAMKKAEKKMGPVQELVGADSDMWDSGY